ncbi:MAG TPA: glycosyltransferase [Pyrinomonadaceae bacterium]|nr:glycosyltransferase [Pyrinomonadaceae bacterium]
MSIKSVHITNYYHKNSGGISTAYNKLLEAANRRQRPVRLIVPGEKADVEQVGEFGRIYYIKANYSPVFDKRYRIMMPWNTYLLDAAPIKTILREEAPDIIEIGEKYTLPLMAGLLRKGVLNVSEKRPMLVHLSCERMDDNVGSFISSGKLSKWFCRRYMGTYNMPMFDFHLANSAYTAQEMIDAVSNGQNGSDPVLNLVWRFLRAPKVELKDRIFINPCGVDNETFTDKRKDRSKREEILSEFGLPAHSKLLLYAGRISPEKNIGLLTKLMKILAGEPAHDFRLLIAGAGPSLEKLRDEASLLGSSLVNILGHINDKEKLADLFANCDAFIHPNPREPFGITPLEAMASGLPVVAPNAGGVLSYANAENAWLAEPSVEKFASAIRDVFKDDALRVAKVNAALATAQKFTWQESTDALFAAYDKMHAEFTGHRDLYAYKESPSGINFAARFTTC